MGRYTSTRTGRFWYMRKNQKEDFWKYVDIGLENECWNWKSSCDKDGYGDWRDSPLERKTHRMSYVLTYNINIDGLCVLHSCDNPKCCNPKHLFLGTHQDNVKDKVSKGRQCVGEENGNHKLTKKDVTEIRELYSSGTYFQKELAKKYGVHQRHISEIVCKKHWKNI